MKISKEKILWSLLIIFLMVNLSSCSSSNDIPIDKENNRESVIDKENNGESVIDKENSGEFVKVYIYDEKKEDFKELDISSDQQRKVLEELNKLNKDCNLYDSNNQYLGLDTAYSDGAYLIKIKNDEEYEVEIVEDNPNSADNRYWYNVKSRNKDIEGIYKTSYNLKEKINRIVLGQWFTLNCHTLILIWVLYSTNYIKSGLRRDCPVAYLQYWNSNQRDYN